MTNIFIGKYKHDQKKLKHLFLTHILYTYHDSFVSIFLLNPFTHTDNLRQLNTMDGRVHSVLKGLKVTPIRQIKNVLIDYLIPLPA